MKYRQKDVVMKGYGSPYIEVDTVFSDGTVNLKVQFYKSMVRKDVSTTTFLSIPLSLDPEEIACVARTMARTLKEVESKSAARHARNLKSIEEALS